MPKVSDINALVTAAAPVVSVAAVMFVWGRWSWLVIAIAALVSAPLFFISRTTMRFEDKFPEWRLRDFERRNRGG